MWGGGCTYYCQYRLRALTLGEDPAMIQKILVHMDKRVSSATTALLPDCRASPSLYVTTLNKGPILRVYFACGKGAGYIFLFYLSGPTPHPDTAKHQDDQRPGGQVYFGRIRGAPSELIKKTRSSKFVS